jgi:signal transduction protein with GAF and PtsI domain
MLGQAERGRPDLDDRSGTRSYLASPLIWGDEQLGVITVGRARPKSIRQTHAKLVSELAEQAAMAVAHARAYARERALRQQGEILVRRLRGLAEEQAIRLGQWNQRLEEVVSQRTADLKKANLSLERGLLDTVRLLVAFRERRLPERASRCRSAITMSGGKGAAIPIGWQARQSRCLPE